jgi:hypothetical protein
MEFEKRQELLNQLIEIKAKVKASNLTYNQLHREKMNEYFRVYVGNRYKTDEEYREKTKELARKRYIAKKEAKKKSQEGSIENPQGEN